MHGTQLRNKSSKTAKVKIMCQALQNTYVRVILNGIHRKEQKRLAFVGHQPYLPNNIKPLTELRARVRLPVTLPVPLTATGVS